LKLRRRGCATMRGARSALRALGAAILLSLAAAARRHGRHDPLPDMRSKEDLMGWSQERPRRRAGEVGTEGLATDGAPPPRLRFLSWSPRIILVEDFLSPSETAHIIQLATCVLATTREHGFRAPHSRAA
jgi:hypothetical protein